MSNLTNTSNTFENKQIAIAAGKKKKGKKHFATLFLNTFQKKANDVLDLYSKSIIYQRKILTTCINEDRVMTTAEAKMFDSLSKLTNKALDKIVPDLRQDDVSVNLKAFNRIEIVDLTNKDVITEAEPTDYKEIKE